MASKNIEKLLGELQSIETKVSTMFLEVALKIMNLTDANIFVLLETSNGRHYGGKEHLCSAYREGNLFALTNDYEVEVDMESSALKFKMPDSFELNADEAPLSDIPASFHVDNAEQDIKFENLETEENGMKIYRAGKRGCKRKNCSTLEIGPAKSTKFEELEVEEDTILVPELGTNEIDSVQNKYGDIDYVKVKQWIMESQNDKINDKISIVKKIKTTDSLLHNTSVERKSLHSVFYGFGSKMVSSLNLSNCSKLSKRALFGVLWEMFPNLHEFASYKMRKNSYQLVSLQSLCYDAFDSSFRDALKKERRKIQGFNRALLYQ